jgi:hypothetical protein
MMIPEDFLVMLCDVHCPELPWSQFGTAAGGSMRLCIPHPGIPWDTHPPDGTGDEWQSQVPGVGPLSVDSPLSVIVFIHGIFQNAVYATPRGFNTKVVQLWMI